MKSEGEREGIREIEGKKGKIGDWREREREFTYIRLNKKFLIHK